MAELRIVKAGIEDVNSLQKIGRQTFYETFAQVNTEENMRKYLDEGFSTERLYKELNDPLAEIYFAKINEDVIGYLKVNTGSSQTELQGNNALEIERIYVLKDFLGKKAGQLLYEKAMEIALLKNYDFVWLGVWEENPRAIRFYEKNGFKAFDKHVFKLGDDEQTDIMMKRAVNNNEVKK